MFRFLVSLPFLVVLILFALSNPQPITLTFWPTDLKLATPLSAAILVGAGGAFVLGALFVWFPALGARRRARRFERATRKLEAQIAGLKKKNEATR
jgi:putative membrane protein